MARKKKTRNVSFKRTFEIEWSARGGEDYNNEDKLLDYIYSTEHAPDQYVIVDAIDVTPK